MDHHMSGQCTRKSHVQLPKHVTVFCTVSLLLCWLLVAALLTWSEPLQVIGRSTWHPQSALQRKTRGLLHHGETSTW